MFIRASVIVLVIAAAPAAASVVEYQPSQGTLPSAQGWSYLGTPGEIGSVAGGEMWYGPTTALGVHYWNYDHPVTMDFSTQTWHIEASVRLNNTSFGSNAGFRRGGFVLFLHDDLGNGVIAEMGSNAISLRNDNLGLTDPSMAFNLSSAFHTVRLEAGPAGGRLLIDGIEQLTLGLATVSGAAAVWFGEPSTVEFTGLTEIRSVTVVPAPGAAAMLGAGLLSWVRRRR